MPLFSFNPTMTTKKAIIIGTLCTIGVSLTAYAIKKGINIKPKTLTATYADTETDINTEPLSNGWNFDIKPTRNENGTIDNNYWQQPNEIQETIQTLTNNNENPITNLTGTSWTFKASGINGFGTDDAVKRFSVNFIINGETGTGNIISPYYYTTNSNRIGTAWLRSENTGYFYFKTTDILYTSNNLTDGEGWYSYETEANPTIFTKVNTPPTISITGGTDVENNDFITWLLTNATQSQTPTESTRKVLINTKSNQKTTTYLGIEYSIANKKTFENGKIKSEGLAYFKITSTGMTSQLLLEQATFTTKIPNMYSTTQNRWPLYKATIKTAKTTSLNMNLSNVSNFEQKYTNITNKTNIYSGEYTWQTSHDNTNWRNGTYSNEQGQRIFTFGHDTTVSSSNMYWTTDYNTNGQIDIFSQRRTNYIVIYYSCEVSNYEPAPTQEDNNNWYQTLFNEIGYTSTFSGYGVSSNPVTPPDIEDGNFISLTGFILNILTLPFTFLSQAFDLTLWANTPWAFNIKNAIFVMIGIMTFIFIIKLFTRGFDSLGNFTDGWQRHKLTKEQRKTAKANRQKAQKAVKKDKKE